MGDELPEYLGNLRVVVKLTEERDALTRQLAAAREQAAKYRAALEAADSWMAGCTCVTKECYGDCIGVQTRRALSLEDKSRG